MPHDEAVVKVLYRRQVENSLSGMDIGDVRHLFPVGPGGIEFPIKQVAVAVDDLGEPGVRTPPAGYGLDTGLAHDSKDLLLVDTKPVLGLKLTGACSRRSPWTRHGRRSAPARFCPCRKESCLRFHL